MSEPDYDVLIVGSGAAGLTAALNLAPHRKVAGLRPGQVPVPYHLCHVGRKGGNVQLTEVELPHLGGVARPAERADDRRAC